MLLEKVFSIPVIIIILSLKSADSRVAEGKFGHREAGNELANGRGLQTRHHNHHHFLQKKHVKCNWDLRSKVRPNGGHVLKRSRYPTLDKIANRLENQIDRGVDRKIRLTTANPLDQWDLVSAAGSRNQWDAVTGNRSKYAYVTVGPEKSGTHDRNAVSAGLEERPDGNALGRRKEFLLGDFTTPGSWENEQSDIFSQFTASSSEDPGKGGATVATFSTRLPEGGKSDSAEEKISGWSFGRLVPRLTEGEDRRKKTTPMPYVAAHEHYEQVLRIGDCHLPKEKIIRVHEVHPDPSKSYSPSCTILHQCGDDTGCCRDLKQVCKPKNTTKVELYFFTTTLGKPQTVEKLHFVNHTECECQKRTDESMPRDSEFRKSHNRKKYLGSTTETEGKRKMADSDRNNCTCPSQYSTRYFPNGTCTCDCFDKQDDCLALKRGKTYFSYRDKMCVQQKICLQPSCEFGPYMKHFGRCPSRRENYHRGWSRPVSYRDLLIT